MQAIQLIFLALTVIVFTTKYEKLMPNLRHLVKGMWVPQHLKLMSIKYQLLIFDEHFYWFFDDKSLNKNQITKIETSRNEQSR